jgi:hypothetical protein
MKKVYILVEIEPYEGYSIKGVYSTLKRAKKHKGKDDEIFHWQINGKDITPKQYVKDGAMTQFERNLPYIQSTIQALNMFKTPERPGFLEALLKATKP